MSAPSRCDRENAAGGVLSRGCGWRLPNRAEAASWLRAHAFRMLLAAVVIVANTAEWSLFPPVFVETRVLSVALIVLAALTPFWPRAASWGIIALTVARTFVFDLSGPSPLWGIWIALVLIGHDCALGWAALACGIVTVSQCVPAFMDSYTALAAVGVEMVSYVGSFVLATLIGVSFRWRTQRDESERRAMALERRQWELDELKRNTELASRIHDTASGGLSYIALTAQRRLRQLPDEPDDADDADAAGVAAGATGMGLAMADVRRDWRFVNDQALAVLDEVHKVIDLLRDGATDETTTIGRETEGHDGCDGIAAVLRASRTKLDRLGFAGDVTLNGSLPVDADPAATHAAERLLGEIMANIIRHTSPGEETYHIVVTLGERSIEIMETNPLANGIAQMNDTDAAGKPEATQEHSHGAGLRLHRELIESLGGELNATGEDGEWVVYARIPVRGGGHGHGARRKEQGLDRTGIGRRCDIELR